MKKRTLEDLHNANYGHKKFAKVCDMLIANGYLVSDIEEGYEKFKFKVNGYCFEYSKNWKSSAKDFNDYLINIVQKIELIAERKKSV